MRHILTIAAFLPLLAAPLLAAPAIAGSSRAPELVPAGDPVNCIQMNQIRDTTVRDDQTIDFRMRNGQVMRNTLPRSCPNLGFQRAFGYRNTTNQLCSVDMITVIQQGGGPSRGASCGLGQFVPMKPAPAEDAAAPAK
ncbi:DUF6491 family protein [Sandaracinobacteroides hominis]|uniref:DUF6491 family protein n=1 Tax=Sandaracinobacteroides hominis TaxID=2780086 RepID=UPI001F351431|nr:DUF6491 family protein [Sandaracinobacteroides hominis]